jgi:CheY-like chemotaxis protein
MGARLSESPRRGLSGGVNRGSDLGPNSQKAVMPRRILVIDDNPAIHDDFRKLLCPGRANAKLDEMESALFGATVRQSSARNQFIVDAALQGKEGFEHVQRSMKLGPRYAVAFVDMRMPPGWDGVETIANAWSVDPEIEMVICSAYCDYSWSDIIRRLARPDRVRLLSKPFSSKDALDHAWNLTSGWLRRQGRKTG